MASKLEKALAILLVSAIGGTGTTGIYKSAKGNIKSALGWYWTSNLLAGSGLLLGAYKVSREDYKTKEKRK